MNKNCQCRIVSLCQMPFMWMRAQIHFTTMLAASTKSVLAGFLRFSFPFCIVSANNCRLIQFGAGWGTINQRKSRPFHFSFWLRTCRFQNGILPFQRWNMTGNCVAVVRRTTKPLHIFATKAFLLVDNIVLCHCYQPFVVDCADNKKKFNFFNWFNSCRQKNVD